MAVRLTENQARLLTALVASLRSDWDEHGIFAALRSAAVRGTAEDVMHAALYAAADRANRTPAVIGMTGEHWLRGHPTGHSGSYRDERCQVEGHASQPASSCAMCRAELLARPDDVPPPEPLLRVHPDRLRVLADQARAAARGAVVALGVPDDQADAYIDRSAAAWTGDVRKAAAGDDS